MLREHPVTRDEVRLKWNHESRFVRILTMPEDACLLAPGGDFGASGYLRIPRAVGIPELWAPLLAELTEAGWKVSEPCISFKPKERICAYCGRIFYTDNLRFPICSDECRRRRKNAKSNRWYHQNQPVNKTRVKRLQAALDGKTCERCGKPITGARRTTRRYCSGACNVAAFRERQKVKEPDAS